jgi:hypothetical protein
MSLLPTAALEQTSNLIQHLTTTPLHPYLPYARFPVLHAVRVAVVWYALTRGKGRGRGYLQDLFGYLVMACTSLLLHLLPHHDKRSSKEKRDTLETHKLIDRGRINNDCPNPLDSPILVPPNTMDHLSPRPLHLSPTAFPTPSLLHPYDIAGHSRSIHRWIH